MQTAPILYFFEGNIGDVPEEYRHRRKTHGNGRHFKDPSKQGVFASPYENVLLQGSANSHKWRQVDKNVYIGISKEFEPESIRRDKVEAGFHQNLAGKLWQIPILNPQSRYCSIPKVETVAWTEEDGKQIVSEVVEQYRDLVEEVADIVLEVEEKLANGVETKLEISDEKMRSIISRSINVNYDVTEEELLVIGVFTTDSYFPIVSSIIDWEGIQQVLLDRMDQVFFLKNENVTGSTSSTKEE